ncbi:RNA-binding CRS1 / YhbY (CRM) domain protein [Euphorbia peplus]|nr:RNA-binding CRS1 / YhbY (CRM) domain protein [Euphorbia peplus]
MASLRGTVTTRLRYAIKRGALPWHCCQVQVDSNLSSFLRTTSVSSTLNDITFVHHRLYGTARHLIEASRLTSSSYFPCGHLLASSSLLKKWECKGYMKDASVELKTDKGVVRFSIGKQPLKNRISERKKTAKQVRISRKAKLNELRFYRLKAKKKMNSPNPEVRIRYKLEKAKRKETWLIEKLRKFGAPKLPAETDDPEMLTEEEKHYLKRTGEKKKNFILVGRRGVFGGVVLNMHLHWKKHETVKVICKPCRPGQIHEYAEELARLSKGIVIDIRPNSSIILYRGKNYVQPEIMSPPETLSKRNAMEKYKFGQSLEHTSQFIEKLEKELEDYLQHVERYKKAKDEEASHLATIAEDP